MPTRNVLLIEILWDKDLLIYFIKYTGIRRTTRSSSIVDASIEINILVALRHLLLISMSQNS